MSPSPKMIGFSGQKSRKVRDVMPLTYTNLTNLCMGCVSLKIRHPPKQVGAGKIEKKKFLMFLLGGEAYFDDDFFFSKNEWKD